MERRDVAQELVSNWLELFGDRLQSAVLFGSVARGEAIENVSDINVMVLIDHIDSATLKKASQCTRQWIKKSLEAPLVFELEQWRRAADAFAIEIADMKDAHILLHGVDAVESAPFEEESMRLQAERELRGKLLQLQTGLLVAGNTPADVGRLLTNSLPSFVTYLRAALRLAGQPAPLKTEDTINHAAGHVGVNPAAFLRVWEARHKKTALKLAVDDPLVDAYYETAEKTADFVDNLRR